MKRYLSLERRCAVLAVLAFVLVCGAAPAMEQEQELAAQELAAQCRRTVTAHVVALNQPLYMNRLGANMPGGMIFALAGDVFPQGTEPEDQTLKNSCRFQTCTHGQVVLREGKRPRPIVLRANEGDCLEIQFKNLLADGSATVTPFTRDASVHVQGLSWDQSSRDDGSAAGANPNSIATTGSSATYRLIAEREGPYMLYSMGDTMSIVNQAVPGSTNTVGGGDGGQLSQGLFGSVNVEPSGAPFAEPWGSEYYRSQVTELDLCLASQDGTWNSGQQTCQRASPDTLPVINYQALYPAGHPRAGLPILNMLCSQKLTPGAISQGACTDGELVASDLTAVITGPSNAKGQPQAFPDMPVNLRPPSLRPVYSYPDRLQPYREFTILYHESFNVVQAFQAELNNLTSLQAAGDNFGINYGMGGLSAMVVSNRLAKGPAADCVDCKFEEFFLSSWAMGDPAMPVDHPTTNCPAQAGGTPTTSETCPTPTRALYPDDPSNVYHSYMSDHVKFRVLHAGADLHHLHHQHAHQWLGTPNSPDGDYLDSQSIGPGTAFTLEMVYNGSGNLNQTVGDSIFHCHFYPHFASGMWSLWRVHDVFEAGTILDPATGAVKTGVPNRALPDGQITAGTATVALVPLATLPMAPVPAKVQLQGVCSDNPAMSCSAAADCGSGATCQDLGSRYCVYEKDPKTGKQVCLSPLQPTDLGWEEVRKAGYKNPGYPYFVPGVGGTRAPHPPLDFAWACSKSGKICSPYQNKAKVGQENAPLSNFALQPEARAEFARPLPDEGVCRPDEGACEPMDGGLPRSVAAQGSQADWFAPTSNVDVSKTIEKLTAIQLPEEGTLLEKVAMATHSVRFHDTQLPDGRKTGVCSDNKAPCTAKDLSECRNPLAATCTDGRINFVLNGLPPQQGAPYADPCINFDRSGGQPRDLLTRAYVAADLQLDAIQNRAGWHFPQQRMISLWGDVQSFLDRQKPPEPLFLRVNSYDCMSYVLANLVPNVYELDDFQIRTPTDILGQHIHLVKFDVTSSDGAGNGWNYEDGTFAPNEVTERIHAINEAGGLYVPKSTRAPDRQTLAAKYIKFFGPGPGARPDNPESGAWMGSQATVQRWYDDPLFNNFGVCSTDVDQPCTLSQPEDIKLGWIAPATGCKNKGFCVSSAGFCSDDVTKRCTEFDLGKCAPGASCIPNQDRTIRTVFTHDHFGPSTHQQAGLYAGVVAEPKGSLWRDNETGEIMGGFDPATGENFPGRQAKQNGMVVFDGGPTSWQAVIETPRKDESFREFLVEFQDSTLTYKPFSVAGNPFEGSTAGVCGTTTDEPCGFCSFTGICSDNGAKCQIQVAGTTGTTGVPQALPAGCGTCNFGLTDNPAAPNLVACTPNSVLAGSTNNPCYTGPNAVSNSCNFVTGIPNAAWTVGAPIGSPGPVGTEAITFSGGTNNFSINYRNEPLYARTTDFYSGQPLPGALGDLSYAFSSQRFCASSPYKICDDNGDCGAGGVCQGRPNPRGSRCSNNLSFICQTDSDCASGGLCKPAGFCADNYNLCVESGDTAAKSLCGSSSTACLSAPASSPYPALTPDVESGDPFTPLLRAYAGDDVQIRTLVGAHINPHNFTLHGMNWLKENSFVDSGWRNTETMGISEHFELLVQVPPPFSDAEAQGKPFSDYMYQPGLAGIEQAGGNWGFLRAYESPQKDLYPVPGRPADPPAVAAVCPQGARTVSYDVVALTAVQSLKGPLVYNQRQGLRDPQALLLFNAKDPRLKCATAGDWSTCTYEGQPEPMVLRAAAGDCIQVTLHNGLPDPSTAICSVQQASSPTPCALGNSCGTNNTGVCGLFPGGQGICSTDLGKTCTPSNLSLKCPAVTCNGTCSNDPNTSCKNGQGQNDPTLCPQLVCIPAVGNVPALDGSPSMGTNLSAMGGVASLQLTDTKTTKKAQSLVSVQVGLRPGLLSFDPLSGDGTNAGFNPVQTAAPGGQVVYTWYAGHIDPDAKTDADRYIPIEFGAANLLGADPLNHYLRGLFAGLIVEPAGASWTPEWGGGAEAYVTYKEDPPVGNGEKRTFHEFVVFMQDDTNNMKLTNYQFNATKTNAVNFKSENLMGLAVPRFCSQQDCQSFLSNGGNQNVACLMSSSTNNTLWCASNNSCAPCNFEPETPTFTAHAGEQMRFRLLHGGGTNTNNVFELAGHNFSEAPYMTAPEFCEPSPTTHTSLHASQFLGTRNLCGSLPFYLPKVGEKLELEDGDLWDASLNEWKGSKMGHGPGNHFDVLVTKAGGPRAICGDYFYRSYVADHFNEGIWGILRVVNPDGSACVPPPAESAPAPATASAGR